MPLKWFTCPDTKTIERNECIKKHGCRMAERCATVPYLSKIGDREDTSKISPSKAGNGARLEYLKATIDYAVDPNNSAFAIMGIGIHEKLSVHKYTHNVLAEEKLSDSEMKGIPDVLEEDEHSYYHNLFILTDYKTWGSYKLAKALGITQVDEPLIENGKPVLLKSGTNKGKPKTIKKTVIDKSTIDLRIEELQLNRYRIFFEENNFPISKIRIMAIPRDGNTYIAKSRGIDKNIYMIPVERLDNQKVLQYYRNLQALVNSALVTGKVPRCNEWENWEGRRCDGYCEVSEACKEMDKEGESKSVSKRLKAQGGGNHE